MQDHFVFNACKSRMGMDDVHREGVPKVRKEGGAAGQGKVAVEPEIRARLDARWTDVITAACPELTSFADMRRLHPL